MELRSYNSSDFFYMNKDDAFLDPDKITEAMGYATVMMKEGHSRHAMRTLAAIVDGYRGYLYILEMRKQKDVGGQKNER